MQINDLDDFLKVKDDIGMVIKGSGGRSYPQFLSYSKYREYLICELVDKDAALKKWVCVAMQQNAG